MLGQHEPRGVHVAARDMRMDVDAAGHHDETVGVDNIDRGRAARRRRDNPVIANPQVADFVAIVGGVDDAAAFQAGQHAAALATWRRAEICAMASATLGAGAPAGETAVTETRVPLSGECRTAS